MKFPAFDYARPAGLDAALDLLAGEAAVLSGGQSLSPMMGFRVARPEKLVDISRLSALRGAALEPDGTLVIGAAVTHAMIEDGALPGPLGGFLARVAGGIAYRAIRNRGTIGGSLCQADPAADWPCVMSLLDAVLVLRRAGGERQVPVRAFLLGHLMTAIEPGELLTVIRIPPQPGARFGMAKSTRKLGEFAEGIAAACLTPGAARVTLGALEVPPATLAVDPALVTGPQPARLTSSPLYAAVDAALKAADATDPAGYRHHLAVLTGCRALIEAAQP
ncbi:carbon monoxide dehydrogenase [Rhodovarius crocodyli]|uniref:Carbon monoxide dehydrogenase n=1 Tax=Rhodovarius crocodyli TaxID=1979269 RepID=A0A437MLZ0_9PROT|nr:FAD binding domain-containing protein [Rhodovarius crocodyli]RVT98645.1 carbon monoxide dehydrogenase [Rhodovarius crocodyli]